MQSHTSLLVFVDSQSNLNGEVISQNHGENPDGKQKHRYKISLHNDMVYVCIYVCMYINVDVITTHTHTHIYIYMNKP